MAEHATPTWYETFESDWKTQLRACRDRWVHLDHEDAVTDLVFDVGRQVVTHEEIARRVPMAEIQKRPAPGAIGSNMAEVIRDSILDPMGDTVADWALKLWEPPDAVVVAWADGGEGS